MDADWGLQCPLCEVVLGGEKRPSEKGIERVYEGIGRETNERERVYIWEVPQ